MLIITKENNSIKVVGQNNPTYPYSGTLVYPLNSVTVVTDKSDMAVFRSALNNDVLFTGLIDDITIAGSTVTKEDIGTKFGAISNSSSSGGETGGGAVDSVNGQTGTVVLTASDVNAYSKTESDGKYATKAEIPSTENLATKDELALKADKSSLDNYLLKTEAQSNYETISGAQDKYQAKLTAGTGIEITGENVINVTLDTNIYQVVESLPESEINPNKIYLVLSAQSGETNLYTEYLYVNSKWEKIGEYKADVDLTPYLKSSEAASTYATKQELAGEVSEREKQDSALGGMIAGETEAREQAINNLTATVQGKLDTATYNSEKATFETKENAAATYQPKGSYLTSIPDEYVTDTELNGKGYATQEWVGEQGYLTEHQDISGLATKEELNGKQDTLVSGTNIKTINGNTILGEGNIQIETTGGGITDAPSDDKTYGRKNGAWSEITEPDLSNYALKSEVPKQYVQDIAFIAGSSINIFDQDSNLKMITFADGITLGENGENVKVKLNDSFVNKVNGKQDTLVSGTNIKTVNGNSLLGSGDITIEGGGSGTAAYDFKGTATCKELTYDVVKEGVILQNITLSEMNITTNGVLITLAKFNNASAVGFALLSEGKYNGTNKPFLAQVLFTNVGGATITKYVSATPTVQKGAEGTETNNYIYSNKSDNVHRAIAWISPGTVGDGEGSSTAGIVIRYWGDDVTNVVKFDYATSTRGGMMRSKDKNKLDTLQTEWFGTQSQFDGLESKDENTLYFITEE